MVAKAPLNKNTQMQKSPFTDNADIIHGCRGVLKQKHTKYIPIPIQYTANTIQMVRQLVGKKLTFAKGAEYWGLVCWKVEVPQVQNQPGQQGLEESNAKNHSYSLSVGRFFWGSKPPGTDTKITVETPEKRFNLINILHLIFVIRHLIFVIQHLTFDIQHSSSLNIQHSTLVTSIALILFKRLRVTLVLH